MVDVAVKISGMETLLQTMYNLGTQQLAGAIMAAQKRAATAARTAATKEVRRIYTIKARDMKDRAKIRVNKGNLETMIEVKGGFEGVQKYKTRENKRGVFVSIKKGKGSTLARSFMLKGRPVAREGKDRYPVHGLYGPAVPQLFGNDAVLDVVGKRAMEVYEQRLVHELRRRLG